MRRLVTGRGHAAAGLARKVFPSRQVFPAQAGIFFRDGKNNRDQGRAHAGHPG